jgi:hypothetical protein
MTYINPYFETNYNLYEYFPSNNSWIILDTSAYPIQFFDTPSASYSPKLDALILVGVKIGSQILPQIVLYLFGI